MKWHLSMVLICISLTSKDVEHLFMCLVAFYISSLDTVSSAQEFLNMLVLEVSSTNKLVRTQAWIYFKNSGDSNIHQGGEPLYYLEAIVLHVRKTDLEMPRHRAKVRVEPRLEFIFGKHSVILDLSATYQYTLVPLTITELVQQGARCSAQGMGVVVASTRGRGFMMNCVTRCLVRCLQLLFSRVLNVSQYFSQSQC